VTEIFSVFFFGMVVFADNPEHENPEDEGKYEEQQGNDENDDDLGLVIS
jgi:hypothetical protein